MKTPALALAFIASLFLATAPALLADDNLVPIKDAVITGNIITTPVTANAKVVVTPLTKATLLSLLGYSNVSPGKAAFFNDGNSGNIVLASTDGKTTYGTIITLQVEQPHATVVGKSGSQTYLDASASLVGTVFTGTSVAHVVATKVGKTLRAARKDSFNGYGTLDGASTPDAVIAGTFQGSYVALTL